MKKLITLLLIFSACYASGQSMLPFRADTIKFYKQGGNAEFVLQNATKDTAGFLYNIGNGVTRFRRALKKLNDSTYLIGPDTLKIHSSGTGIGGSADSSIYVTIHRMDSINALNARAATTITINGVTQTIAANRTWNVGTIVATDTANKWLTGVFKRNDSVFVNKGGTWIFAFKDSTGGGSSTPDTLKVRWPLYSLQGSGGAPDTLVFNKFTGSDSGYMTPSMWATVLKYADSAGMLNPYLRKIDTTNRTIRLFPGTNVTITGTFPNYTLNASGGTYTASQSITLSGSNFTLTNDNATPGNSYAYGTNSSGTKGFNKMAVIDTAGIADGSFTYYDNASGTWKMLAPVANKNLRWNGTAWVFKDTTAVGAGGSPNTSVGSGFRVAINGTNNIKSLTGGIDMLLDTTTSNQVNISADTTTGSTKLATQGDVDRGIAAVGLLQVTAINDSTTSRLATSDTSKAMDVLAHRKNIVGDATASGKAWRLYGTSITETATPTNVTAAQSYATLAPQALGFVPDNRAKAGTTTMQYSAGDSSVENKIYTIPTFSSAHGLLSLEGPGLNDFYVPFGHTFDTVALKAVLSKWVDTAHTRGWPYDSIAFISGPYTTSTQYPHAHDANRAAQTVAETKGIKWVDMESYMQVRSGYFTPGDSVHSNSVGHGMYVANILKTLTNYKKVGFVNVKGGGLYEDSLQIIGKLRTGNWTPAAGTWNNILGGKTIAGDQIFVGGTTDRSGAKIETETSLNQVGVSVYETASGKVSRVYGGEIQINDGTYTGFYRPSEIQVGNNNFFFKASSNNSLMVGTYGGVWVNYSKVASYDFFVRGVTSDYLFNTRAYDDRVGIGTNTLTQKFNVAGSVGISDSALFSGVFRTNGLGATLSLDTTNYKLDVVDASGYHRLMNWPTGGGSGEVNTASNLGVTTYGLYKTKSGVDLQFKSLTASTGIVLTSNTNDVAIGVSIDTTNISSFAAKVRSLFSVLSPFIYNSATGLLSLDTAAGKWRSENYYNTKFLSSIDTGNITNFYAKVRSLHTVGSFMTYNSATGLIGLDTTVQHSTAFFDGRYAFAGAGGAYTGSRSIDLVGSDFRLKGDSASLNGPPYVYGSQNGIRTFYKAITTNLTSPAQGDVMIYKASDTTLVNTTRPAFLLYNNYRADTVLTTDATQTTIATIATAGSAYYSKGTLEITLDAASTTAGISGSRIYRFVNNGGTLTITDQTDIAADDLATLTTASWTVTVSGNNLLVKVTGQASQSLNWIVLSKIHWSQTAL